MTPALSLKGIGKKYKISQGISLNPKELFGFGKKEKSRDFWALEDVDLEVQSGTTLGILGRNGAGKSTLLKIISGVLQPTTGEVQVNGRLTAIFGLGSGFNPEFTGRENVMLNGLILGIDRQDMLDRFDDIAAFADIGEFIDQPIKTYSSGMKSRLGFAVAVNVDPDILVLDEALSAGDAAFKRKALQRMYDLRDSGTTVLFVSHSMGMVEKFCTDAVLLHQGHVMTAGSPSEVVVQYRELLESTQGKKDSGNTDFDQRLDYAIAHEDEEEMRDPVTGRPLDGGGGSKGPRPVMGGADIRSVELLDENRGPVGALSPGDNLTVRVHLLYTEAVRGSALNVVLREREGKLLFATSTAMEKTPLGDREAGESVTVDFTFGLPLHPGGYGVDAVASIPGEEGALLGRAKEATTFEISERGDGRPARGLMRLPTEVEIHDREEQGRFT